MTDLQKKPVRQMILRAFPPRRAQPTCHLDQSVSQSAAVLSPGSGRMQRQRTSEVAFLGHVCQFWGSYSSVYRASKDAKSYAGHCESRHDLSFPPDGHDYCTVKVVPPVPVKLPVEESSKHSL